MIIMDIVKKEYIIEGINSHINRICTTLFLRFSFLQKGYGSLGKAAVPKSECMGPGVNSVYTSLMSFDKILTTVVHDSICGMH